jgi:hypothetical protein
MSLTTKFEMFSRDHLRDPSIYPDPVCAAVLEYSIDLGALGSLSTLAFVQPTSDWLEFVTHCRLGRTHKPHVAAGTQFYEAVFGPMFAVGAGSGVVIAGWEQLSFHDVYGVGLLGVRNPVFTRKPEAAMNDVPALERSFSNKMRDEIDTCIQRCLLLMERAFQKDIDTRNSFRDWLAEEFAASRSPAVLLHEDPLYMAARFLGIGRSEIDATIMRRATKVAEDNRW